MTIEVTSTVSIGETYGNKKIPNIVIEDAKFFGRPNFSGEEDRFRDSRRKFTVCIPNDIADELRNLGYNVKTSIPTDEERAEGREELSHLKVMLNMNDDEPNKGAQVYAIQGETHEKLNSNTVAILDRARFENVDMEIRGWEYDPDEQPGQYSARLVQLVAVIRPNRLEEKYGMLR